MVADPVDDASKKAAVEADTRVIEWVTEIFGVIWGVWLGFTLQSILMNRDQAGTPDSWVYSFLQSITPLLLIGLTIILCVYCYFFIRWLWTLRFIAVGSNPRAGLGSLFRGAAAWLFAILALLLLAAIYAIPNTWILMGIFISLGWVGVVCALVAADKEGWR